MVTNAQNGNPELNLIGYGVSEIPVGEENGLVHVNQVGYYTTQEKLGVIVSGQTGMQYFIRSQDLSEIVFTGYLSEEEYWDKSDESVALANFSEFTVTGDYVLDVPDIGRSYSFKIAKDTWSSVSAASVKALYFNRASMALEEEYAGQWARALGHPDDEVLVHESAATDLIPANTVISSPGGWYDAGDFGKYVVPAATALFDILNAYEKFTPYYEEVNLNIPESENSIPDILDEALWELDWLLTMQDPNDGGVYHKLTTPNFENMIPPAEATGLQERYVIFKGTGASLSFAAIMAMASRIYEPYDSEKAAIFLQASKDAWNWAEANPSEYYDQAAINSAYDPNINTGDYPDSDMIQEFSWAGVELFVSSGDVAYLDSFNPTYLLSDLGNTFPQLNGIITLLNHQDLLSATNISANDIKVHLINLADQFVTSRNENPYRVDISNFSWGSNSIVAQKASVMLWAYLFTQDQKYLNATVSGVDYIFGRNAVDYSFLTGFGDQQVFNIHHRQSHGDDISKPVPGWLSGGVNGSWAEIGFCDGEDFGNIEAKAFKDLECAYSMTEVALNWNSPLIFILGGLDYLYQGGQLLDLSEASEGPSLAFSEISSNSISLTWNENFTDEESFELMRSTDGGNSFELLATLDANISSYIDSNLIFNTTYHYKIRASKGIVYTKYSNALKANTLNFVQDQGFVVNENSTVGTTVGQLTFSGVASAIFTATGGDLQQFEISSTGELSIAEGAGILDHESQSTYQLNVLVEAEDNIEASIVVSILVNNLNEAPVVSGATFSIDENAPQGTEVGTVNSSDPEGDPLSYQITNGNMGQAFSISESGILIVNTESALDFDQIQSFELTIEVSDGSLTSSAAIKVNLNMVLGNEEINDEHAIYPNPAYDKIYLTESVNRIWLQTLSGHTIITKENVSEINVVDLVEGIYILVVQFKAGSTIEKKIIIRH